MAGDEMDATNCIIIGSLGVVEFSVFFLFAILSFFYSKNQRARVGFLSIALYCTLELPRYISLIYDQAYDSRSTFIIFIFANFFFSVTFSTYCMLLNDSARVIPPRTVDLVRPAYLIFFLCYMGLCIAASYEMVTAASFDGGRDSFEYDALDVFEATSFIFFGALSIYLVHCLHFQLHELSVRMATEGSDVDVAIKARFSNCSNPADIQLKIEENILQRELVLDKLYSVGRLVLVAALVRGVVLFLGYERPNYDGPVYWALSALIPRGLATMAFLIGFGNSGGRFKVALLFNYLTRNKNNKLLIKTKTKKKSPTVDNSSVELTSPKKRGTLMKAIHLMQSSRTLEENGGLTPEERESRQTEISKDIANVMHVDFLDNLSDDELE